MRRIIIDYPDDCTEQDAVLHAEGCFNQSQLDYKRVNGGYNHGIGIQFCNGRKGYFYQTVHGNYVLKLEEKEN